MHKKLFRRGQKRWVAIACIFAGIVLIVVVVALFLKRRPPEPIAPIPFASPITHTIYLPLTAKNHPLPIEHGIAATYYNLPGMCSRMQEMNADWYYNWSHRTSLVCQGIEFVPMIWEPVLIGNEISPDAEWLLGFNECDGAGQCNTSPEDAAIAWRELEVEYPDVKLVSPAPAYGLPWLEQWYIAYTDLYTDTPRLSAVAVHCYGTFADCKLRIEEFIDFADEIGVAEVWVTEFAWPPHRGSYELTLETMETMVAWFKGEPRITRWAWWALTYEGTEWFAPWGTPNTSLVDFDTGELTGCGELYRDLAH